MFLCVSGTKGLKTGEKGAKFTQLAESVPVLSENYRNGPWKLYFEEKSTSVLQESQYDISDPWSIILKFWQNWSVNFVNWQF